MSDEIRNDDMNGLQDRFNKLVEEGRLNACPNLTYLPDEEKRKIIKNVSEKCGEMMMKTYISLGILGESMLQMEDGISKTKYELVFKAFNNDKS